MRGLDPRIHPIPKKILDGSPVKPAPPGREGRN
jgi:hypothetical protein